MLACDSAAMLSEASVIKAQLPVEGIMAGTSTRIGGMSLAPWNQLNLGLHVGDNPSHVGLNRQLLSDYLAWENPAAWLNQVHGDQVIEVDRFSLRVDESLLQADGAYTLQYHLPLVIQTADCLPIVFASTQNTWIGAVHCGWRSLAANIIQNLVATHQGEASDLVCWLGPCLSQANFQVGEDVLEAFVAAPIKNPQYAPFFQAEENNKWRFDLQGLAIYQLQELGITQIFSARDQENTPCCTFADAQRFFSYRREPITGRMVTFIYRTRPSVI